MLPGEVQKPFNLAEVLYFLWHIQQTSMELVLTEGDEMCKGHRLMGVPEKQQTAAAAAHCYMGEVVKTYTYFSYAFRKKQDGIFKPKDRSDIFASKL